MTNNTANVLDLNLDITDLAAQTKGKGECARRLVDTAGTDRLKLMQAAQLLLSEVGKTAVQLRLADKNKSKDLKEHLKALRSAAGVALETHDRACGAGFFGRQAARAETLRRLESRALGRANAQEMAAAFEPVMDLALTRLAATLADAVAEMQEANKA